MWMRELKVQYENGSLLLTSDSVGLGKSVFWSLWVSANIFVKWGVKALISHGFMLLITWDNVMPERKVNVAKHPNLCFEGQPWIKDPLRSEHTQLSLVLLSSSESSCHPWWTVMSISHSFWLPEFPHWSWWDTSSNYAMPRYVLDRWARKEER